MGKLASFQENFRKAVHAGEMPEALKANIVADKLSATSRMQVYQNNYRMTLVGLLLEVFPLTMAFVGEDFLRAAAGQFLSEQPPTDPGLDHYGAEFPSFLRAYPYAADVLYVADLAELEWAVHQFQYVIGLTEGAEPAAIGIKGYALNPNVKLIQSGYPLVQLWMVGMGQLVPETVHLEAGGQNVMVVLDGYEVKLHALTGQETDFLAMAQTTSLAKTENIASDVLQMLVSKSIIVSQPVAGD